MKKYGNILQCESNFKEMTESVQKVEVNVKTLHAELQMVNSEFLQEISKNLAQVHLQTEEQHSLAEFKEPSTAAKLKSALSSEPIDTSLIRFLESILVHQDLYHALSRENLLESPRQTIQTVKETIEYIAATENAKRNYLKLGLTKVTSQQSGQKLTLNLDQQDILVIVHACLNQALRASKPEQLLPVIRA